MDDRSKISIVVLYVDDLKHYYGNKRQQEILLRELSKKYGQLSVATGDTGIYIGIEYQFDRKDKSVKLTMNKYVDKLISKRIRNACRW